MIYLCNTFSLHMLQPMGCEHTQQLNVTRISAQDAGNLLRKNAFRSFFGHRHSAYHLGRYLHVTIPVCRGTVTLTERDMLLVAAIQSKRLWEQGWKGCPGWRFFLISCREDPDEDCA